MINKNIKEDYKTKISHEILEYLIIGFIISIFFYYFLYFTSNSIGEHYFNSKNIYLNEYQIITFSTWVKSICFLICVVVFMSFFLFLFGQKISYLILIIKCIDSIQKNDENFKIKLEGNDELTELAKSINYLVYTQKQLNKKEQELKQEREDMIRSLSHDIRTPLTSIISYSDYMKNKKNITSEEIQNYIILVKKKSEQIKILTDYLLGKENKNYEEIENGKFLMEQLVYECEEILEDKFICNINLEKCNSFRYIFNVDDLQRIFDNIASNIEKYADPLMPIQIDIITKHNNLIIIQKNTINKNISSKVESHKIGLNSISKIVKKYNGEIKLSKENYIFEIQIIFNI